MTPTCGYWLSNDVPACVWLQAPDFFFFILNHNRVAGLIRVYTPEI